MFPWLLAEACQRNKGEKEKKINLKLFYFKQSDFNKSMTKNAQSK